VPYPLKALLMVGIGGRVGAGQDYRIVTPRLQGSEPTKVVFWIISTDNVAFRSG